MQKMIVMQAIVTGNFGMERWISFGVSWIFVLLAIWGAIAFFPRKADRGNTAPAWLVLAIWCGFVGAGLNAFYWRVFGDMAAYYQWFTVMELRNFGNIWGDLIWKGLGCVSIYLHFYARWKSLSPEEQRKWHPLAMGFYPNAHRTAARCLNTWHRCVRYRKQK